MHDINEQIAIIWEALEAYRREEIPEGWKSFDAKWDKICTAMAVIQEDLGLSEEADK